MSEVNFGIVPAGLPHQAFIKAAAAEFPVIANELVDESYAGLIHLQVACLTRYANDCLAKGNLQEFERLVRFVERLLPAADSALDNALYVSFIKYKGLGIGWRAAGTKGGQGPLANSLFGALRGGAAVLGHITGYRLAFSAPASATGSGARGRPSSRSS